MLALRSTSVKSLSGGISGSTESAPQSNYLLPQARLSASHPRLFPPHPRYSGADTRLFMPDTRYSEADTRLFMPDTRYSGADTRLFTPDTRYSGADTRLFVADNLACAPENLSKMVNFTIFDPFSTAKPIFWRFWPV